MLRFLTTRQFWPRLAITAGTVLLLLLMAGGLVAWWVNHQWNVRIAAIRAAGDPASIADLAPEPIPDDQNAAAILQRIEPQLEAFSKEQWAFWESPLGEALDEAQERGETPSEDQLVAVRQILAKYPEIDAALAAAAACDEYASRLDFAHGTMGLIDDNMEPLIALRTAARFQAWRMLVLAADGEQDKAVQRGIDLLHIARLHDAEPTIVNYLVGIAVRGVAAEPLYNALAAGPVSPQLHAALDAELARHDDPQRLVHALTTERAFVISGIESGDQCEHCIDDLPGSTLLRSYFMKWQGLGIFDGFDHQIAQADVPWHERQQRTPGDGEQANRGVLADLLLPTIQAAYDAQDRYLVMLRALRIDNALTAYREEHGHEAAGLDDLSLPKGATIDPFSGQPFILKHTDAGWIIYSVMENGVDDGGDFKDRKDWGLAPPGYRAE